MMFKGRTRSATRPLQCLCNHSRLFPDSFADIRGVCGMILVFCLGRIQNGVPNFWLTRRAGKFQLLSTCSLFQALLVPVVSILTIRTG